MAFRALAMGSVFGNVRFAEFSQKLHLQSAVKSPLCRLLEALLRGAAAPDSCWLGSRLPAPGPHPCSAPRAGPSVWKPGQGATCGLFSFMS